MVGKGKGMAERGEWLEKGKGKEADGGRGRQAQLQRKGHMEIEPEISH